MARGSREIPRPTQGRCSRNLPLSHRETNLDQLYEEDESTTSREVVTVTTLPQGNREELMLSYKETNTYNDFDQLYEEEATTRRGLVKRRIERELLSRQQPTSNIETNTPEDSDHCSSCGDSILEQGQDLHSNLASFYEVSEEHSVRGLERVCLRGSSNSAMTLHVLSADGEQHDGSNLLLDNGQQHFDNSKPDTPQIVEYHDDDSHNRISLHASDCLLPHKTPYKVYFDTDHHRTGMVEIWPDIFVPFKDQGETSCAIISGHCTLVTCLCCSLLVECCDDVLYVLCPRCNVVNPVVSFSTPIFLWRKHCACLWGSRKYEDDICKEGKKASVCVGIAQNSYYPLWPL